VNAVSRARERPIQERFKEPPLPPFAEHKISLEDGRELGVSEFGDPDGFPVLWFHGTPGARRQIPPDAPAYAACHNTRLIVPERPGVGWSTSHGERTLLSFAEDIGELLDAFGISKVGLAGLSGGGPHVLAVAHELSDRVVGAALLGGMVPMHGPDAPAGLPDLLPVALRAVHRLRGPLSELMTQLLKPIELHHIDVIMPLALRLLPEHDSRIIGTPGFRQMFSEDLYEASRFQFRAQIHDMSAMAQDWGFSPRELQVPVKSWHGSADMLVPLPHARHLVDLIPHAELVTIEDSGHFAGYTKAPEVIDWLLTCAQSTINRATPHKRRRKEK
jgi:pimeloyl-ACP methyl ester carboxylesterase